MAESTDGNMPAICYEQKPGQLL